MQTTERIIMLLLLFSLLGLGGWFYFAYQHQQQALREAVARGEFERPIETGEEIVVPEDWQVIYPKTIPIFIGDTPVKASVADTLSSRMKGLSGTPFMPDDVVKLFAFGVPGPQSIWMKDMNYSIDVIWVAKEGEIVHIAEDVSPETYPKSFSSPIPAWFVIETNAGFVSKNSIVLGDEVVIPIDTKPTNDTITP